MPVKSAGFQLEHPGIILWEEYLQPREITQTRFSRDIDISFTRANELLNGKRGFTPDTALRVAKYLGMSAEFWMNWQGAYDLQRTEKAKRGEYKKIPVAG
ncbi:MAG TPA: addiction module antidote protein, HigA family [Nitrospirae bacterium]|nr:addiction module antidote protein, HigA family [Nitrospirota bacterium]